MVCFAKFLLQFRFTYSLVWLWIFYSIAPRIPPGRCLWKTFFYQNNIVCMQIQKITIVSNPKGDKKAPSIRIRLRHIFRVFSTSYEKRFSIKMTLFSSRYKNLLSYRTRREEIKRPLSESAFDTFFMFSRHLMKNVFLSKWHCLHADSRIYYRLESEGG